MATQGWQCPVCGKVYSPSVATCFTDHSVKLGSTWQTCSRCGNLYVGSHACVWWGQSSPPSPNINYAPSAR